MDPFDRLIQAVDQWLAEHPTTEEVFAQIGKGTYQPRHCKFVPFLTPDEYRNNFTQARFVVSHAGMGSIITAMELGKLIVVVPKRASLGEQRNEHQLATVKYFQKSNLVKVADWEADLPRAMEEAFQLTTQQSSPGQSQGQVVDCPPSPQLIHYVRDFVMSAHSL